MINQDITTIFQFIPRKNLSAQSNLDAFIAMARNHLTNWEDQEGFIWESGIWSTTYCRIRFTNEENAGLHRAKIPTSDQLMHPAFLDVAKAYLRHRHHTAPHRSIGREVSALRALEYVLRQDLGVPDITKVSERHFQQAISTLARLKSVATVAVSLIEILQRLADFNIVTPRAHYWKHQYHGDLSYAKTYGQYAPDEIKDKKVPDQDALLALAEVFSRGYHQRLEDADVMITSITALLLSSPMRIMETVQLRPDCLATDKDKNGKTQYYLKYFVPKINSFARKPIPEAMAETAIEAIRRLLEMTKDGRALARYMETGPTKFYRHADCPSVSDDQLLTREEVTQAMGFLNTECAETYFKRMTGSWAMSGYTLNTLWKIVLADHRQSNPNFPYQRPLIAREVPPLKMSDSLLCCLRKQFSTGMKTCPVLLAPFNKDYYSGRINASLNMNGKAQVYCFFTRHGFEPVKLKSHSFRHFLNRLAKQSGVPIDVITSWSSRSSNRQTLTYLENDKGETASQVAALSELEVELGTQQPISSEEADIYGQGPIHRSRYGLCRRSWRIGPCNKFADCLNCSEVLICKGDKFAADVIAAEREELGKTYRAAQEAITRGERSATRWMSVSRPQIVKLDALLSILNDPKIPDGSPIEIAGTDFSHERTLLNPKAEHSGINVVDKKKLAIEYGDDLLACLDELRKRNA